METIEQRHHFPRRIVGWMSMVLRCGVSVIIEELQWHMSKFESRIAGPTLCKGVFRICIVLENSNVVNVMMIFHDMSLVRINCANTRKSISISAQIEEENNTIVNHLIVSTEAS